MTVTSVQDHAFVLPVLKNSPEISREENLHQERSVDLPLPHISDMFGVFFFFFFFKQKDKENHLSFI